MGEELSKDDMRLPFETVKELVKTGDVAWDSDAVVIVGLAMEAMAEDAGILAEERMEDREKVRPDVEAANDAIDFMMPSQKQHIDEILRRDWGDKEFVKHLRGGGD